MHADGAPNMTRFPTVCCADLGPTMRWHFSMHWPSSPMTWTLNGFTLFQHAKMCKALAKCFTKRHMFEETGDTDTLN